MSRVTRWYSWSSLIVGALAVLAACASGPQKPPQLVIALFDVTGSTLGRREAYLRDFKRVLACVAEEAKNRVRPEGWLLADTITENPFAHSEFRIRARISARDPMRETELFYRQRVQGLLDNILNQARTILQQHEGQSRGTHIMDALLVVERAFSAYDKADHVLVVFSDMIEQSDRYDFSSVDLSQPSAVDAIIARERREKRMPSLAGVRVYVVGAGAARKGGLSPARIAAIRSFWFRYFQATGADLSTERYGTVLLRYEGCD